MALTPAEQIELMDALRELLEASEGYAGIPEAKQEWMLWNAQRRARRAIAKPINPTPPDDIGAYIQKNV